MIEWIIVPPRMALRFSIGAVVPIEWPSNECSTLLSSGPRTIPIHQLFYTIVVEISRHARQALRIALPNSLCPVFHWFNLFISAATSSVNERQRDRGFQFLCDFAGGRKKMKWRKIDCVENFWQVYIDVIDMVFGVLEERKIIFGLGFVEWNQFLCFSIYYYPRKETDLLILILNSRYIYIRIWIIVRGIDICIFSYRINLGVFTYFAIINRKVIKIEKEKFFDLTSLKIPSLWWKLVSSFPISAGYR